MGIVSCDFLHLEKGARSFSGIIDVGRTIGDIGQKVDKESFCILHAVNLRIKGDDSGFPLGKACGDPTD